MKTKCTTAGWKTARNLLVALVLGGGVTVLCIRAKVITAESSIKVIGTLPARDVAKIRRVVQHDLWLGLLPPTPRLQQLTWYIPQLPGRICGLIRNPERIEWMSVNADGSVAVHTYRPWHIKVGTKVEDWGCSGSTYVLKNGAKGWQILSKGWWQS